MPIKHIVTTSASETRELGRHLGDRCKPGDVICLIGDLGAGKTQLTQGIAAGLGIPVESVTSPTFALIAEHYEGRIPLYHMDAYRLADSSELGPIGFDDYLSRGDGVLVIEWADRIASALPQDRCRVELHIAEEEDRREIIVESFGDSSALLVQAVY